MVSDGRYRTKKLCSSYDKKVFQQHRISRTNIGFTVQVSSFRNIRLRMILLTAYRNFNVTMASATHNIVTIQKRTAILLS